MDWRTKLLDPTPRARQDYRSLATPVYRGSTVVFEDQSQVSEDWQQARNGYQDKVTEHKMNVKRRPHTRGCRGTLITFA